MGMAIKLLKWIFCIFVSTSLGYTLWSLKFSKEETLHHNRVLKDSDPWYAMKTRKELKRLKFEELDASHIDLVVIFTNAEGNYGLLYNFKRTLTSLMEWSSAPVKLHLISDEKSFDIALNILKEIRNLNQNGYLQMFYVSAKNLSEEVKPTVRILQKFFTQRENSYYRDFLFFFSLFLHKLLPKLEKIIMIDIDIWVQADIAELYSYFDKFSETQFIGMAPELSPVYYHVLHQYRKIHPKSMLGQPLSQGGFPGFNSGVMLINIPKLKNSTIIQSYMTQSKLEETASNYNFQGHLGDQDLYTLIYFDHPQIFHILPCEWNRQLCEWWKTHGYADVFDQFFACEPKPKIIHGNCKSVITQGVS